MKEIEACEHSPKWIYFDLRVNYTFPPVFQERLCNPRCAYMCVCVDDVLVYICNMSMCMYECMRIHYQYKENIY